MSTIQVGKSAATQLKAGAAILAAARTVDTRLIKDRLGAFDRAQQGYADAHAKVLQAEASLETAQVEFRTEQEAVVDGLARALLADGQPLRHPFAGFGAATQGAIMHMPPGEVVKALPQLIATIRRSKTLGKLTLQALPAAEKATRAMDQAVTRWTICAPRRITPTRLAMRLRKNGRRRSALSARLTSYQHADQRYDVEIRRDTFGVPNIYGKTDADVAFGLAYAHAEDDFATIQETLLLARGELASLKGRSAAATDYFVGLLGARELVAARYGLDLSAAVRAVAEAYADGLNYYAATRLREHFGRVDVPLGQVQRLVRGPIDLPLDGGPDVLRAIRGTRDASGRLIADDGDGLILLVEWDPIGRVHSHSVHQFGSATSVPHSPHFSDQSPLFADMQLKPVWFDEQDLAQHLSERYRPGHRGSAR